MINNNLKNIIVSWQYLRPHWKRELLILLLGLAAIGVSLVNPYIGKLVIDKAYAQRDLKLFLILLLCAGLLFVINSLIGGLSSYLEESIVFKVILRLNKKVFRKIQNLPYESFQDRTTGRYISLLNNDVNSIAFFITRTMPQIVFLIFSFLSTLIIAIRLNWKMTILALGLSIFIYIYTYLFIRPLKKRKENLSEGSINALERVREVISNMQLVKSFGQEAFEIRRYIGQIINNLRLQISDLKLSILTSLAKNWLDRIFMGLLSIYGGYQIIKGTMTLGTFTAIMLYINQLIGRVGSLAGLYEQIVLSGISWQRLNNILSIPDDEDKQTEEFLFSQGEIQFRDVSFGYKEDKLVLRHLGFDIKGGNIVGLVGLSGCGKTTMVNLIIRLYRPKEGAILVDSQDVSSIKIKSLTEQIGLAVQKPIFWNDSLLNNIKYGRPKATDQEAFWVAKVAQADDFIKGLPRGYNTVMGEGGSRLSEGQKQRIALARAIIKKPKILIIDEGMSSLDSQTEDKIIDNLKQELKNTTIIVVSHRLSTIKKMDLVYFLESCDRMTSGQHEQLVKENSGYRELFASQLEKEQEKAPV